MKNMRVLKKAISRKGNGARGRRRKPSHEQVYCV